MSSRLPNQYPTVITRNFTNDNEDDAERHILELKGSYSDGTTSYDKTTGQEMGILFSARQNQTTHANNNLAMIMVDPVIDSGGDNPTYGITSSNLVFKTVVDVDGTSTMTTALTLSDGGLSISDVSFSSVADNFIIQNTTTGGNITIDNQDADKKGNNNQEVMMLILLLRSKKVERSFAVTGAGEVAMRKLTVTGNTLLQQIRLFKIN